MSRMVIQCLLLIWGLLVAPLLSSAPGPILTSFTYAAGSGKLILQFDSLVNAGRLNSSAFSFQSMVSSDESVIVGKSFNNLSLQGNTTEITVYLTAESFARLRAHAIIAKSISSTYISFPISSFYSALGAPNTVFQSKHNALLATAYEADRLPTFVQYFDLDINAENARMTITFSEPVDVESFSPVGLAFQNKERFSLQPIDNDDLVGSYVVLNKMKKWEMIST